MGGRLTLLKSFLGTLPTSFMSLFKDLEGILRFLESLWNYFFLGVDLKERKMTSVSWNKVMA